MLEHVTPASYDFNDHYTPLYVKNQGNAPTCWWHSWSSRLEAFRRMYDGKVITYDPYAIHWTSVPVEDGAQGMQWTVPDGTMLMVQHDRVWSDLDIIKEAVLTNGLIEVAVSSHSPAFHDCWYALDLPVINDVPTDVAEMDHSIFAVGYTPAGLLIQNSWSLSWGYRGRAVLGWDYVLDPKHCMLLLWGYPPHPVDGLVLPPVRQPTPAPAPLPTPAPTGKKKFMLIKKANTPSIYMVLGGHLDHIPNMAVLTAQGYTLKDVQTLPDSNPLWKLPLLPAK